MKITRPTVVFFIQVELDSFPVTKYGEVISNDTEIFPNKTNVDFVEILSRKEIKMRVHER